jgi:hypothetical protein
MGVEDYTLAVTAYKNINYFNNGDFNAAANTNEFTAPGTNFKITLEEGLSASENGSHRMYLISDSNIWMAVDGTGEEEKMDIFEDKLTKKVYSRCEFKRTFDVLRTAEVVRYSNL